MRNSCAGKWSVQTVLFCFVFLINELLDIEKTKIVIHSVLNFFHMLLVSQI